MKALVICNGFSPQSMPIFEKYWTKIKKTTPKLKLTIFTIPYLKGITTNDIFKDKEFQDWVETKKKWVEIGQMGYMGNNNSECTRFKKIQYKLIKRGYKKIMRYMPDSIHSFRPTDNRIDQNTFSILQSLGFSICIYHKSFIVLKKIINPIEDFILIETSIDSDRKRPDNIQIINDKVVRTIKDMKKNKYEFITISGLFENCIDTTDNYGLKYQEEECF